MHFALKFSPLCNITRPKEELLPNQKSPCGKSLSAFVARRNYNILFVKFSDVRGLNELRSNASIQVRIIKYYNIQIRKTYLKIVYNLLDKAITIYLFHVKHYILFYNTNTNFQKSFLLI